MQKNISIKIIYVFLLLSTFISSAVISSTPLSSPTDEQELTYWLKIKANNKYERTAVEDMGLPIEIVRDDYVISYGTEKNKKDLIKNKMLIASSPILSTEDFPTQDGIYHNYTELTAALQKLATDNPDIIELNSIGKSIEGREIWHLRISTELDTSNEKPAAIFLGGHHAREHLSIDVPLRLTQKFIDAYRTGDTRITRLMQSREIHVIPMVNPDGAEFDIATGNYRLWRKNRRQNKDGSYGVDLNRNYGFQWGTGGSSKDPRQDTYMGPTPFSEPETIAIKTFIEQQTNATVLLSFHTFSELILYPWGHTYNSIPDLRDHNVFTTMANKMSEWNKYKPQQSSALYIASGDTTDWAYGQQKIFAFTFELDPSRSLGAGGFYPGPDVIPSVVQKNWEPFLYLMEYADNPYRSTDLLQAWR